MIAFFPEHSSPLLFPGLPSFIFWKDHLNIKKEREKMWDSNKTNIIVGEYWQGNVKTWNKIFSFLADWLNLLHTHTNISEPLKLLKCLPGASWINFVQFKSIDTFIFSLVEFYYNWRFQIMKRKCHFVILSSKLLQLITVNVTISYKKEPYSLIFL